MTRSTKTNMPILDTAALTSSAGQALYDRARKIIPGGTQLFSKRPELFLPDLWPVYYAKANGIEVWDLDQNHFLDFASVGIGTCVFGASDPEIDAAVASAIQAGSMSTLNNPDEVELAELLVELHPWSDLVRFARTGGEAMTVAARVVRAATGRDKIAFCGYHGWGDWYLAANLSSAENLDAHLLAGLQPTGVPSALQGSAIPFRYNNIESLREIVSQSGQSLAGIVMEPYGVAGEPDLSFLKEVREIADACGAVLVFDEVTSGWRMNTGGVHMRLGIEPDVAVFAKCISNGYPMAAIIGRHEVMDAAQNSFISSAYWTERIGPAAALATIRKHRRENVGEYLIHVGGVLQAGWETAAADNGLSLKYFGMPPQRGFIFNHDKPDVLTTLFTQEMLKRGFLATPRVFATTKHQDREIALYFDAVGEVFAIIAKAIADGDPQSWLDGRVKHSHFERLN